MTTATGRPPATSPDTWNRFLEAGRRLQTDRDAALAELAELFRSGTPPRSLKGTTEGALVGFTIHPAFDRFAAAVTSRWLPWAGKRFDATRARGDNLVLPSARWPAKLLWPRYGMRRVGDRLAGFDFETRIESGALDPDCEVLVIDYAPVEANPNLGIKRIRDELVEAAPGAYLGKMLWRHGDWEGYSLLAYFALRERGGAANAASH
jgi:hypothetical protein